MKPGVGRHLRPTFRIHSRRCNPQSLATRASNLAVESRHPGCTKRTFKSFAALRFSAYGRLLNETKPIHDSAIPEIEAESALTSEEEVSKSTDVATTSAGPWYLRNDRPFTDKLLLSSRQILPDIPENSPPLLQPTVEFISGDLGLDDLSLLDLRNLDPPPGLGANLLMIICTARSEKHLHTAADSLCKFLKREHSLRPDASGFIGRNELKLFRRRKSKRSNLLGSASEDVDDGIKSSWVCVTVDIPNVETEVESNGSSNMTFVGFGKNLWKTKLVIQMLMEEKRKDLDLEKLWGDIQKRQELAKQRLLESSDGIAPLDDSLGPPSAIDEVHPSST